MAATDTDVIRELEKRRFGTLVAHDLAGFADLCHPDLTYVHSSGTLDTLGSFVEKCENSHYVYHRIDHLVESVKVIGDTAVIVSDMHIDITAGGVRRELTNRALGVWARVDGRWRFLAHQATPKR